MLLIFWNATIKWSHKTISTLRTVSIQLVEATLTDRFYMSTSVFFFYVIFGFAFPLHRKYKNQSIPYIVGDNFSVCGQVEQKLSWETFINVTSKRSSGDSSFVRQVELYPDYLVYRFTERWRGVVDQMYTGLLSGGEVEKREKFSSYWKEEKGKGSARADGRVDSVRFFARKEIDFSSLDVAQFTSRSDGARKGQSESSSNRKGRSSSISKSYPLRENGRRGNYQAKGWWYTFLKPWDEIPFKLESDNLLHDTLQWDSISQSPSKEVIPSLSPSVNDESEKDQEPSFQREIEKTTFSLSPWFETDWTTTWSRLTEKYEKETLQEAIDNFFEFDVTPWEEMASEELIEGRSMSGHRCPDMVRNQLNALRRHRWSQRLFSLRPFQPPQGGWHDFIQTIQIPLPSTASIALPGAFLPSDFFSPYVEIKYRQLDLAGLKQFEALFRESVQDIIDSERLELIPMEKILYRGPAVALDEAGTKGDLVSFFEETSDDFYEWGNNHFSVENPLASRQQNFFGKKSYLKDEPVTKRTVRLRVRHQDGIYRKKLKNAALPIKKIDTTMAEVGAEETTHPLPTKGTKLQKRRILEPIKVNKSTKKALAKIRLPWFDRAQAVRGLQGFADRGVQESSFFPTISLDEYPMIPVIKSEDWTKMVETEIEKEVNLRVYLAKFGLEVPIIPVARATGRPVLWPRTQIEYESFNRSFLEYHPPENSRKAPPVMYNDAPRSSSNMIEEPTLYSSWSNPIYQRSKSRFLAPKWPDWWTRLTNFQPMGVHRGRTYREVWEPITILSWMMVYKFLFVLWIEQVGKDFYQSYGKEILLYFINILASLGFDAETLIDDLGLGEAPNYLRVIPTTERRFRDLAGIDTILPTLGEIVWFLRSSGRGKSIPKGFLLVGPPGTGKTYLVQAIAGEAEVPVVIQSASLLIDPEAKESPLERLKNVFDQARKNAPCILFIDEIDTLGVSRKGVIRNTMGANQLVESIMDPSQSVEGGWWGKGIGRDETQIDQLENQPEEAVFDRRGDEAHQLTGVLDTQKLSLLMQLLVEMDGLHALKGLVVIGATNRPAVLDPALLRPGRFEKVIHVELPGEGKRIEILQLYTKQMGVAQEVSWEYLAHRTAGFSAADLAAVMNQSLMQAILQTTTHTIETIETGIEVIGRQTSQKGFPTEDGFCAKRDPFLPTRLAYYQAGKMVVQTILPPDMAVSYLPLWPSPRLEAVDPTKPSLDQSFCDTLDRSAVEARLIGLYAGKAGERFAFFSDLQPTRQRISSQAVWDSDLGAEEIQLATEVGMLLLTNWYLDSNAIRLQGRNQVLATQNQKEFDDPSEVEFCRSLADEYQMRGERGWEGHAGSQTHSFSAWWQSQVTKEVELVQPPYSKWSRLYLPDPADAEQNEEWVPPDQHYHVTIACQSMVISERNALLSWNEFQQFYRDYLLHGLLTTCFNQAFTLIEERRELLDKSADHLIRFQLLRRHTIEQLDLQFPF